ncbi:MAG: hypothetical protein IPK83_13210 [Planctomycetes bacterium]|nr:hypothetical protein [Planctomycetota bacterium]
MSTHLIIHDRTMMQILKELSLRTYDDFVGGGAGEVVSRRESGETRWIPIRGSDGSEALYLKVYRYEPLSWRTLFVRDKCTMESRNYAALREFGGVAVPDVIAAGHRRKSGRLQSAFILTRGVRAARRLDEWLDDRNTNIMARVRLLAEFADLIARMHRAGFYHVDLQLRNVLVSLVEPDRPTLYLIDSARGGLRYWSVRQEYGRFRDLSSLHKGGRQVERTGAIAMVETVSGCRAAG